MPDVVIKRDKVAFADRMRAYAVAIDGKKRGELRQGGVLRCPVDRGAHEVRLSVDWCGSRAMTIEVADEDVILSCRPNAKLPWLAFLMLFTSGRWIELRTGP